MRHKALGVMGAPGLWRGPARLQADVHCRPILMRSRCATLRCLVLPAHGAALQLKSQRTQP